MRRQVLIGAASLGIAIFAVALLSAVASPIAEPAELEPLDEEDKERRISFEEYESSVWPYLSKERSFRRTSPINVVVKGDTETVTRILQERDPANWEETPSDEQAAGPGEQVGTEPNTTDGGGIDRVAIDWESAEGATRYAYVSDGEEGIWIDETAQLHDGDYYGHRYHVRLYASPDESEPWIAMQAHSEHFDWFTLRHAVHGTQDSQHRVESAFFDDPRVQDIWREHVGNDDSSDSDGWTSMVELVVLLSLISTRSLSASRRWFDGSERSRTGSAESSRLETVLQRHLTPVDRRRLRSLRDRFSLRKVALAGTIVAILLGVRFGGIALERHTDFLTMHQIAGLLYPFIAVGIPLATYLLAGGIERRMDAATTASVGMAAGIVLDYAYIGLDVIPIVVLFQRLALIFALGLIAGGAAKRAARDTRLNALVIVGVVLWVVLLAATLLGRI